MPGGRDARSHPRGRRPRPRSSRQRISDRSGTGRPIATTATADGWSLPSSPRDQARLTAHRSEYEIRQAFTLVALRPEQQVVLLRPAVEQMAVHVPREAHAAMDLYAFGGDQVGRLRDEALGHRGRALTVGLVGVRNPCGVMGAHSRELELV